MIWVLVAWGLLFSSCMREQLETSQAVVSSFRAEIVEDFIPEEMRSTVNLSSGATAFASGDEAVITGGSSYGIYSYDGSKFVYVSETAQSFGVEDAAFFPAGMVTGKGSGRILNLDLSSFANQDCANKSILYNLPMGGRFNGSSVCCFYNLCTILKISASSGAATSEKTLSKVEFISHEAPVSGTAQYKDHQLVMDANGGKTITLTNSPSSLGSPTKWYLKLPAQTYPGGFELKMTFADGKTYTYSTNKTVALQPGYISAMDAFTCEYFSGGSGTKANPYRIASKADLRDMNNRIT